MPKKRTLFISSLLIFLVLFVVEFFEIEYFSKNNYYFIFDKNVEKINKNYACEIPSIHLEDKSAIEYLNKDYEDLKKKFKTCDTANATKEEGHTYNHLISIETFENLENATTKYHYKIKINTTLLENEFKVNVTDLECFVQRFDKVINKTEKGKELKMLDTKKSFDQNFELILSKEGFYYIECHKLNFTYKNVFNVFPMNMSKLKENRLVYKENVKKFINNLKIKNNDLLFDTDLNKCFKGIDQNNFNPNKMNILMLGIDSVSHNHFKRIFPLTYSYLNNEVQDNTIFDHFNSVGENTHPNVLALLSGIMIYGVAEFNISSEINYFKKIDGTFHDSIPFIWNKYEDEGYITHYQEDLPSIAIFNYLKDGFRYWPTCHYGRPFWINYYKMRTGPYKCHYKEATYITWLKQIEQFIEQMNLDNNRNTPYFSFNFLSEFTHDYLAVPKNMDFYIKNLIEGLNNKGYFNNTLLIVFSDHGNRLKYFSYATELGKLERYLPFLSIKLPKQLKNTNYYKNIMNNKNKLVSFYDLYQTLRHFSYINKYGIDNFEETLKKDPDCENQFKKNLHNKRNLRGISLFEQIPQNRSCQDAIIPEKYCNCFKKVDINEQDFLNETKYSFNNASLVAVDYINNITNHIRDDCMLYQLDKIVSFKKKILSKIIIYSIVLILNPGEAWFEINLKLTSHNKKSVLLLNDSPIRLSAYGSQAFCTKNSFIANFCYCNPLNATVFNS